MSFFEIRNSACKTHTLSVLASALLLTTPIFASAEETKTYSEVMKQGRVVFDKYGISRDLPKLAISSLVQGEHLVEHAHRTLQVGDQVRDSSVYLVKNTDTKGNIDLRVKYNPTELDDNDKLLNEIETFTRTEYRLRNYAESFDPSSVRVQEVSDSKVIVSFKYSKYGLPQDIAYFRFLNVDIELVDGQPKRMLISNEKPFKHHTYNVETYHQEIEFYTLDSGKVVIASKMTEVTGTSKNKPMKMTSLVEPVAIYEDDNAVQVLNEERLEEVSDPRMQEASVKLDRVFPLMGDMVRRQGIDLPLPFGVSVAYRNQDMDIPMTDYVIGGVRLNDLFDPEDSVATVNAESLSIRGDINILPFWNVFGYVGKVNVDANIDASYTGAAGKYLQDKLNDKLPGLGNKLCEGVSALCNSGRLNVPLHLEYDLRGAGTTLSVGYKEFFASVTGTYSQTRLKGLDDWGDGIITVQPMLGYQLVDYRAQFFVGAEYQGLNSRMQGTVKTDDIEFDYDVGVDIDQWAFLTGVNKQIGKHYNMTVLYNKGETRSALTLNFGYRF
ncbi:Outer membrane protein beta-barrel domain-containing protein [Vibrio crassostreae]|nr:Outer membrane protein beta-barrel domain-containing protein [Vibrio crassostreae]CAK1790474.1 Outer membrane protein beta-barrel domain-containing protein [Vibrio crassostreae]CAK1841339.1 Outer membrane protein beta-barrel domain-containing protein [Vibrio crassostreae]CAK2272928.1 Outer membrane protein beta-barrel domain-containing protein [Vibrio crassostreae]CAK2642997.1 Outer membrane protein beta-barrel domain-containing protein [Vibrio crassostreae]